MTEFVQEIDSSCFFVGDSLNKRIKILDKSTKAVVRVVNIDPAIVLTGLSIHGNYFYQSDTKSHTIKEIDVNTGTTMRSFGSGYGRGPGELNYPNFTVVFAPDSLPENQHLLLVSDYSNNRLCAFNLISGEFSHIIGSGINGPMGIILWNPDSNADPASTQLLVCDRDNSRVAFFNVLSGEFVRSIGSGRRNRELGSFNCPNSLAIHRPPNGGPEDEILVVVDRDNRRIQLFNLVSGAVLRAISGEREMDSHLTDPVDVIVWTCPEGNTEIIVSDMRDSRLQVYDLDTGRFVRSIGPATGTDDELSTPFGICVMMEDTKAEPYILK